MKTTLLIATTTLLICLSSYSQTEQTLSRRCGSMERVDNFFRKNKNLQAILEKSVAAEARINRATTARLQATITVPVVVHIVLPNPYIVTDADVQAQLARLNLDFSGLNTDSANIASQFGPLRGHSRIQFCLARRTPTGELTSGIERRSSTTGSDIGAQKDPIKYTSEGGLDAWNPDQYLNYWVGVDATGSGVLGYSQFPNAIGEPAASDGVFINYRAWGTNNCYTHSDFNLGRTAVHETGHYFGLLHTWGDEPGCSGDDFAALTTAGSGCVLPAGLFNPQGQGNTTADIGDTPNQGGESVGCPSTQIKTDSCSKTGAGIMYQNLMDYSNDACLTLFTNKQVERMEYVLTHCRVGLTTSPGCQPPANPVLLDVAPTQSVSPGGFETTGCNTTYYSSVLLCPGNIVPKVRIANNGLTTVTNVTVGFQLDNGTPSTKSVNVNILTGATEVVSFSPLPLTTGVHTIKFFTANPNGSADQVKANDTLSQTVTVVGSATLPVKADFETGYPAGWAIDNYNNDATWERKSPGKSSNWSLYINNYEIDATENFDDLKSPRLNTTGVDSLIITFDLAHKNYPDPDFADTLTVLLTKDCGTTYQTVYKKWGSELATAGSSTDPYNAPAESDWRTEKIALAGSILSSGEVNVIFRNTTRYGNNVFLDNINIEGKKENFVLKQRGFLIVPTAFRDNFAVLFSQPPTTLRYINVYNALGQLVLSKPYSNVSTTYIPVYLPGMAAGAYLVRLMYSDNKKDSAEWLIKY